MQPSFENKKKQLIRILRRFDRLAVALSGGVDSALLLAEAHDVLGDRLIAVTVRSAIHPERDVSDATQLAAELGVPHLIVDSDALRMADFISNPPERCYICKKEVFGQLVTLVREKGVKHLAHGANADDLGDYRPGLNAARELGVVAPLMDAGFTKADIRRAARERGLSVWNKPAMACLATRFPYGTPITLDRIEQIKEAEEFLDAAGFTGGRVRYHGDVARIEVPLDQLPAMIEDPLRGRIVNQLRKIGFLHVSVDLEGYVTGSMNRTLDPDSLPHIVSQSKLP